MYEIVPGFLLNLAVAIVVSNATFTQDAEVQQEFTAMEEELAAS
jgi:sodium/proline symporter